MEPDTADVEVQKSRESSSIAFPYTDLDDAVDASKKMFEKGGGRCSIDQFASYLEHDTVNSGAFRLKVAAAKMFGFIEGSRDLELSDLGAEVVEADREASARSRAFLQVPLYKATFERFRGRQLPPDIALERVFVDLGVAKKQAAKARQVFQRSAQQSGFFAHGRDRLVEPQFKAGSSHPLGQPSGNPAAPPVPTPYSSSVPELVSAMFKQLPPEGAEFPLERREKWLSTLQNVLELVYGSRLP